VPRQIIYFTQKTFDDLKRYIVAKHGTKRAMSITVEEAVKDYIKHQQLLEKLNR